MRIRLTVPKEHVDETTLGLALEASTAVAQKQLESGEVPTAEDAIDQGLVRWQPEPSDQGFEGFDLPSDALARGWADCDDLAPWHAASLRHSGEDPDAQAIVYQSGKTRWHAVVQRGDGTIDDPSRWAGMGQPGSPLPVTSPVRPGESAVGFKRLVSGASRARIDVPLGTVNGDIVGVALERGGENPYDALKNAADGALFVSMYWGASDDVLVRLHAIAHLLAGGDEEEFAEVTGCGYDELGPFVGALAHRIGAGGRGRGGHHHRHGQQGGVVGATTVTASVNPSDIANIAATIFDPLGIRNMIAPLATGMMQGGGGGGGLTASLQAPSASFSARGGGGGAGGRNCGGKGQKPCVTTTFTPIIGHGGRGAQGGDRHLDAYGHGGGSFFGDETQTELLDEDENEEESTYWRDRGRSGFGRTNLDTSGDSAADCPPGQHREVWGVTPVCVPNTVDGPFSDDAPIFADEPYGDERGEDIPPARRSRAHGGGASGRTEFQTSGLVGVARPQPSRQARQSRSQQAQMRSQQGGYQGFLQQQAMQQQGQQPFDDGFGGYGPDMSSMYGGQGQFYGGDSAMQPYAPYAGQPGVNPYTGAPMIPGSDLSVDPYGGLAAPTAFEAYAAQYRAEQPVSAFDGTMMTGDGPE